MTRLQLAHQGSSGPIGAAMPLTVAFSRVRRALLEVGREEGVKPETLRLVLALAEAGGSSTTDVLGLAMCSLHETQVRRGLIEARSCGWVVGGDKRGTRLPIDLTVSGQVVADRLLAATASNQKLCPREEA